MRLRTLAGAALLCASLCMPAFPQVGDDLKAAGENTKDAASTATHKTGHAVKKGARKTKHETKKGVHKAANKVSDKTQDTDH